MPTTRTIHAAVGLAACLLAAVARLLGAQEAAALADPTLDPKYRGFIAVPHTPVLIKLNLKPRADLTWDPQNTGNDDRFIPAQIPVEGDPEKGGGARFNLNGKGSQISLDVRAPTEPGEGRFYYRNDFFGSSGGSFPYRLRDLYGQYYGFLAGMTQSVFADSSLRFDTVDYRGPNALVTDRKPLVSYDLPLGEEWRLKLGLEQPDGDADGASEDLHPAPDSTAHLRWERAGAGHAQASAVARAIGARDAADDRQVVFGWGVNLSAEIELSARDALRGQLVYGEGIGTLGNDAAYYDGIDAAYDGTGDLEPLPYASALAGLTHRWSEEFRSSASYGFVNVGNEEAQAGDAYHRTQYASANLVWRVSPILQAGLEGLFGSRETKDGSRGQAWRTQLSFVYSLFE